MTDKINDIVIPILRSMQEDVSVLKTDVGVLKESVRRIDAKVSAMDNYMAGFHSNLNWHRMELEEHGSRIEKMEQLPTEEDTPDN